MEPRLNRLLRECEDIFGTGDVGIKVAAFIRDAFEAGRQNMADAVAADSQEMLRRQQDRFLEEYEASPTRKPEGDEIQQR